MGLLVYWAYCQYWASCATQASPIDMIVNKRASLLRPNFPSSYFQIKTNLKWNFKSIVLTYFIKNGTFGTLWQSFINSRQLHTVLIPDLGHQLSTLWLGSTGTARHVRCSTWILSWWANTLTSIQFWPQFSPPKRLWNALELRASRWAMQCFVWIFVEYFH